MPYDKWRELLIRKKSERRVPRSYVAVEMNHNTKMLFIKAFSEKLGDANWCRENNLLLKRIIND